MGGSWFARGTVLVKVRARPNGPCAERILLAPCRRFLLGKMRVCVGLHVHVCILGVYSIILTRLFFILPVGWSETLPDTPVDEMPPGPEVPEKIKKRYRKKKTKLEEAFPTYLQVCRRWHNKVLAAISAVMGLMAFSLFNCHRISPASAVALKFSMIDATY